MGKRYAPVLGVAENGGYSEWIQPEMGGYKMACCDCGLVHDLQFRVMRVDEVLGDGYKVVSEVEGFAVHMRAKRNERATGQMRRKRNEA